MKSIIDRDYIFTLVDRITRPAPYKGVDPLFKLKQRFPAWSRALLFSWINPFVGERLARLLDAVSLHPRYGSFAEGIISLENLVYFVGVALVGFAVARFSFDLRRVGV